MDDTLVAGWSIYATRFPNENHSCVIDVLSLLSRLAPSQTSTGNDIFSHGIASQKLHDLRSLEIGIAVFLLGWEPRQFRVVLIDWKENCKLAGCRWSGMLSLEGFEFLAHKLMSPPVLLLAVDGAVD
tara:strand:- start:665 stop:1045 length:381 start_codon:yes stop_codon:yes gene_type:complete